MTEHVTISLDAEQLELARREAQLVGVSVESYLARLIQGHLPALDSRSGDKPHISTIFGIGASVDATDVGIDKHVMLGEAVWSEHLRKTQASG